MIKSVEKDSEEQEKEILAKILEDQKKNKEKEDEMSIKRMQKELNKMEQLKLEEEIKAIIG